MGFWANSFFSAQFWHPGFWAGSETPSNVVDTHDGGHNRKRKHQDWGAVRQEKEKLRQDILDAVAYITGVPEVLEIPDEVQVVRIQAIAKAKPKAQRMDFEKAARQIRDWTAEYRQYLAEVDEDDVETIMMFL